VVHPFEEDHTMPAPLSPDLRRRFQRYIEDGLSGRDAARRLMISPATGARLAKRVRRGEPLAPRKCGRPSGWGKLGPHHDFLRELVEQDPDITMPELRDALAEAEGLRVHETSLSRVLRRLGFTYKKSRWSLMSDEERMSPAPAATG
jgi:transposase